MLQWRWRCGYNFNSRRKVFCCLFCWCFQLSDVVRMHNFNKASMQLFVLLCDQWRWLQWRAYFFADIMHVFEEYHANKKQRASIRCPNIAVQLVKDSSWQGPKVGFLGHSSTKVTISSIKCGCFSFVQECKFRTPSWSNVSPVQPAKSYCCMMFSQSFLQERHGAFVRYFFPQHCFRRWLARSVLAKVRVDLETDDLLLELDIDTTCPAAAVWL